MKPRPAFTAFIAFGCLFAAASGRASGPLQQGIDFGKGTIEPITAAETERLREKGVLAETFRVAFTNGDLATARRASERRLAADPSDVRASCDLADVEFRQRRYARAYAAVEPFISKDAPKEVMLRAALATALAGEPQRLFQTYSLTYLTENVEAGLLSGSLPSAGSKQAPVIYAALALGTLSSSSWADPWSRMYSQIALSADASNPLANYVLGEILRREGKFSEAKQRFRTATVRGRGKMLQLAKRGLKESQALLRSPSKGPGDSKAGGQ